MKQIQITPPDGYEVDQDESSFELIVFKKSKPKIAQRWSDLQTVRGYYVHANSTIVSANTTVSAVNRNIFPTKADAESSRALAQLLQLRKQVVENWKPDWTDGQIKYSIDGIKNQIDISSWTRIMNPISFPNFELADRFRETHISLLKTYFQIED